MTAMGTKLNELDFVPGPPNPTGPISFVLDTVGQKRKDVTRIANAGFAIKYFTKKYTIFTLGAIYDGNQQRFKESGFESTYANVQGYVSMEYFFSENISVAPQLLYSVRSTTQENKDLFYRPAGNTRNRLRFSASIRYFCFGKKKKE